MAPIPGFTEIAPFGLSPASGRMFGLSEIEAAYETLVMTTEYSPAKTERPSMVVFSKVG